MAAATVAPPASSFMALDIADYSHDYFQSLPSLEQVRSKFIDRAGLELVEKEIKDFFITEGMDRTFGIALLHRHFNLAVDRLLVEVNGTSTPWPVEFNGMPVYPSIWGFSSDNQLRPTEFRYSSEPATKFGEKELAFITKFKAMVDKHGLGGLVGLSRYPGDDFESQLEITVGNANINLKEKDWPEGIQAVETQYYFSEEILKKNCKCLCDASKPVHAHGQHVN